MALCFNVAYAVSEGGFKVQFFEELSDDGPGPSPIPVLTPVRPRYGDHGTLARNLSMLVGSLKGDMLGTFQLTGTTDITVGEGKITRTEESSFTVRYVSNGSTDLYLAGTLSRTIELPWPGQGAAPMADLITTVSVGPDHGPALNSFTETRLRSSDALPIVLPWSFLLDGTDELSDGMEMNVEKDAVLEGLTLPMDRSLMSYRVMVKDTGKGALKAVITAEGSPFNGMWTSYSLVMDSTNPWPIDIDTRAEGIYMSDDGPVVIDLRYRESLVSWTRGSGRPVMWPAGQRHITDPISEIMAVAEVPQGGSGSSSYAALPSQCYAHARGASPVISDFSDENGPLSPLRLSYHRNDTRPSDRSWVWNITLSSSPTASVGSAVEFSVSCISGDRLGRDQLELREAMTVGAASIPPTGRRMLTLSSHETVLRSSPLAHSFFTPEGYSPSYKLDIVYRGNMGPDTMNILLQNMLGIHRSDARDLYISSSNDKLDPKTICICVVDGSSGQLISTSKASGSFAALLNTYGFELS